MLIYFYQFRDFPRRDITGVDVSKILLVAFFDSNDEKTIIVFTGNEFSPDPATVQHTIEQSTNSSPYGNDLFVHCSDNTSTQDEISQHEAIVRRILLHNGYTEYNARQVILL